MLRSASITICVYVGGVMYWALIPEKSASETPRASAQPFQT